MAALALAVALAALQDPPVDESEPVPLQAVAPEPEPPPAEPLPRRIVPVEDPAVSRKITDRPEPGPGLGAFALGSAAVVALLLAAFVLFKRFARNSRFFSGSGPIRLLARKALGGRHDLFLVEVGPRILLLGASRDRLGTLGEFSEPDELARLRADLPGRAEGTFRESFRETLREGIRAEERPAPEGVYASISEELAEIGRTVRAWKA